MTRDRTHESLLELTAKAARQCSAAERDIDLEGARLPQVGDLYLFPETNSLPVEWMVATRAHQSAIRVIPCDANPLTGPSDISISDQASCGPLTLRPGFGVTLPPSAFDPQLRVGGVETTWFENDLARVESEASDDDPVVDPDLKDWYDSVSARAQVLLGTRSTEGITIEASQTQALWRSSLLPISGNPFGIAASILLVIAVGLGGGLIRQMREIETVERRLQDAQLQLEEARGTADSPRQNPEAESDRELQRLTARHEAISTELRTRITDLEGQLEDARVKKPILNLPLVWLSPSETVRGESRRFEVAGRPGSFLMILEVQDSRVFNSFSVEIHDLRSGTSVWNGSDMIRSGPAEIVLVLPNELFPAGDYRVSLLGSKETRLQPIADYSLRVAQISSDS